MAKRQRQDSSSCESDLYDDPISSISRSQSVETAATHASKYITLDHHSDITPLIRCLLPPHRPLTFTTYSEYETHYQQCHSNRCTDCKNNFPSAHFLELHIAENHDPIVASQRSANIKTYHCFVEGCDKICLDWKKRRSHLVDKHGYPRNYDFLVVDHGIDGKQSMLRSGVDANGHRKSSRERAPERPGGTTTDRTPPDGLSGVEPSDAVPVSRDHETESTAGNVGHVIASLSSLDMVPRAITFGRRNGRNGFAKA